MRHTFWLCAFAALFTLGFTGTASAKRSSAVRINVLNCLHGQAHLRVQSFNGRDSNRSYAKETLRLKAKNDTGTIKCRGEGKGACDLLIVAKNSAQNKRFSKTKKNVKRNKWVRVKAVWSRDKASSGLVIDVSDSQPTCD
ncbi:MAG: hypothetical protein ACE366_06210 [Bradymonadia bacterium]